MSTLYALYLRLLMVTGAPRLFGRLLRDPWYFGVLSGWTDRLSIGAGARVLELGCGPGRLSIRLEAAGASVLGIDRSAGMVDLAERTARAHASAARFSRTSAEEMATTAERFDWVIAASLLNVVANPLDVLRTAVQVTSPGGHGAFLVPTPAMTTPAAKAYAKRLRLGPFSRAILGTWQRRARTMDPNHLVELMSDAGYHGIRTDFPMDGMLVNARGQVSPSTAS
jgi:ubiquinone/menaquinone biosynthesis C-methylase UbiE